jgi:acetolactate synthase-1/2/3 large subunit
MRLVRVPYNTDHARETLARFKRIVLVNAKPPVGFFAYPGKPSTHYADDVQFVTLSRPDQDATAALQALVDALGAPPAEIPDPGPRPGVPSGKVSPEGLAQAVAALMPAHAIVSDESVSYGRGFYPHTFAAPPHDWLHLAGGAIGDGLPVATGAAIGAGGERRVISLQADGSAMYSLQSLWTQAREKLPCTTIIIANRKYSILIGEYANVGANPGRTAMDMLDLGNPDLNWVQLANGMGVEGAAASDLDELSDLLRASFERRGPFLIELLV